MKEHLYRLLLEQHNQEVLFDELSDMGVDLHEICIDNLEIIIDIIGLPEDNSYGYWRHENPISDDAIPYPKSEKPFFDRTWLREEYYRVLQKISEEENMFVVADNIETIQGADEEGTERLLREYIDWLYKEKRNWKRRKK